MKPTAILTSDWHIREDTPICRTDDYQVAQWKKIRFILDLQNKYQCPIIHAGDMFHNWKVTPKLLSTFFSMLKYTPDYYKILIVPGNHDLPQHNMELIDHSGLGVLLAADEVCLFEWRDKNIKVMHEFVYKGDKPFPGVPLTQSSSLIMQKYQKHKLILTGDNHQCFTDTYKGTLLINPGSIMRMTASQIDHEPTVFLWYSENNTIVRVILPHDKGVISREHIDVVEEREDRLSSFVSGLSEEIEVTLSFRKNLELYMKKENIHQAVRNKVLEALDSK